MNKTIHSSVRVVLVEPIYPVNLGQVARVMKNFGFQNLVLVNPSVKALREAVTYSAHAREVLDRAEIKHSLAEALSDAKLVIGSTSKAGASGKNVLRSSVTPAEFAETLHNSSQHSVCALVFGRESTGLTNEELDCCDMLVTIPASQEYRVLNLSHSVCILLYELYQKNGESPRIGLPPLAGRKEKDRILMYFEEIMKRINYRSHKRPIAVRVARNLLGKSAVSRREAHTLVGVLRRINDELRKGSSTYSSTSG
jgi:tRNA/rRNA methyltransferase